MTQSETVPRISLWKALLLAIVGGLLLDAATPSLGWWWVVFPGVAVILVALWQQRIWRGALIGAAAGAAFWMPHISWLTLYLGPVPWLGLCGLMIIWFALFGFLAALTTRGMAITSWLVRRPLLLAGAQALAVAGLWVAREQVQGSLPYGGFPWGRLVHTQADGPLAQSVSWVGFAGLSGLIALACAVPVAVWFMTRSQKASEAAALRDPVPGDPVLSDPVLRRYAPLVAAAASLALLVLLALVPNAALDSRGTLRVAAVQGNSKSGIFDDRESGAVLNDHIRATKTLLDKLEAKGESVDVIVWPENSAEFNFAGNRIGRFQVEELADRANAPIVIGSVMPNEDGTYTNSTLVWGSAGEEPGRYDKNYPVPFAEYMPNRDFFHALAPDLVDLVQLEYTPGKRSPVIDVTTEAGTVRAGLAICFDIIFDQQAVELTRDRAEVIFAQTNNADFGHTDESAQQLAIARMRAIETGRALVNISTVGTSAVVAPDGTDLARLKPFTADAMVAEVPLVEGETPALRFGSAIATLWGLCAVAGIAVGAAALLRRPRKYND
ncbi:apolipoprotein N-acyltransferase [Leucobacter viscericola]|uniref:Apolipoprotein N-acyltransferase n=1 Tax=Leucobacter viscericola TaxID=2714935 RepID=A0A6G7XBA9_9MICO|nr:apolipoprotein N-acyltransferase [Leucobacter viscericola]QIK61845.1 apolipoprotein N-acyltransferase [Leucobacter viscericola]